MNTFELIPIARSYIFKIQGRIRKYLRKYVICKNCNFSTCLAYDLLFQPMNKLAHLEEKIIDIVTSKKSHSQLSS